MKTIKSLVAAAVLTFALAVSAAGQQATECKPGETQTPPCPSGAVMSDPNDPAWVPGETQTPPEGQSVEVVSLVELALHVLLLA